MQDGIILVLHTMIRRKLDFILHSIWKRKNKQTKNVVVFVWGGDSLFYFTKMSGEKQIKHSISLETLSK